MQKGAGQASPHQYTMYRIVASECAAELFPGQAIDMNRTATLAVQFPDTVQTGVIGGYVNGGQPHRRHPARRGGVIQIQKTPAGDSGGLKFYRVKPVLEIHTENVPP